MVGNKTVFPKNGSAKGLAESMFCALLTLLPMKAVQERWQSCPTDGAYVLAGVGGEICNALGGNISWRPLPWDVAHLLELVLKGAREDLTGKISLPSVSWYQKHLDEVNDLQTAFRSGKARMMAEETAQEAGDAFKQPQLAQCGGRFVAQELKSHKSYLANWPTYVQELATKATVLEEEAAEEEAVEPRALRKKEQAALDAHQRITTILPRPLQVSATQNLYFSNWYFLSWAAPLHRRSVRQVVAADVR